jgi:hypothetical protein
MTLAIALTMMCAGIVSVALRDALIVRYAM